MKPLGRLCAMLMILAVGPRAEAEPETAPAELVKQIDQGLASKRLPSDLAERRAYLTELVQRVAPRVAQNVLASEALAEARQAVEQQPDEAACARLTDALDETREILAFQPLSEAPLPEGFPPLTPVGEIQLREYPAYRLARVPMGKREDGAFMALFAHITSNDIAMTAPVEMVRPTKPDEQGQMAFLYQNMRIGTPGKQGNVEVIDVPAMTAVSMGLRGNAIKAQIARAEKQLRNWLAAHAEYEAAGPLRTMGHNSPFVVPKLRYFEVQIPVKKKAAAEGR